MKNRYLNFRRGVFYIPFLTLLLSFPVLPGYGQGVKVNWENFQWQVLSSRFFDIHYPEGYEELGRHALRYAEEANIYLSETLQHKLSEAISIYIYPSHRHFQMTNITMGFIDESTGGFTESRKKRVVIPFMGGYDQFRHVLSHELVHVFQYDILMADNSISMAASFSAPLWLMEGMAEYLSIGWDQSGEMTIRDAVLSDTMPTVDQMTYMQVSNTYMLYKAGQSLMYYIDETYGLKKIGELLKDARDQQRFNDAIKTNLGISTSRLNDEWHLWLKRNYYKEIERKVDREQAHILTDGEEYSAGFNIHPSISPDGKTMVYLTSRKYQPVLVLKEMDLNSDKPDYTLKPEKDEPNKESKEKVLLTGGNNSRFKALHFLDNRISFTPDSQKIFFCAQGRGKDVLYLFDIEKRKVVESWSPGVDTVQFPDLAADGKQAVFTGLAKGRADLYVLNLETGKLRNITDDYFNEKHATFSSDGKTIYYSSNRNAEQNIESAVYHLFAYNIETGENRQLTFNEGNQLNPFAVGDSTLLYISDQTGILNAFSMDTESGESRQLTDAAGAILQAQSDQDESVYLFSFYRKQRYDIGVIEKNKLPAAPQGGEKRPDFSHREFPAAPDDLSAVVEKEYFPRFSIDRFFLGFQYSNYYGPGGFIYLTIDEYMGNHMFEAFVDAASQSENYQIKYAYLKNRIDWYFTGFRASNFYSILNFTDLRTINDFIYNPNFVTRSIYREGAVASAAYPINSFFILALGLEVSRYEEIFYEDLPKEYERQDIKTNIYGINAGLQYNNVLYSYAGPLKGLSVRVNDNQTMNLFGEDYVYNRFETDFRGYLLLGNRSVFVSRIFGGISGGPQGEYFPWLLGGYNTLRGHPFLSIQGKYALMSKLELRFPLVDYIIFGLPVQWATRGFSGVAFVDLGGAIDEPSRWRTYDPDTGRLDDLKMSYGLGMRIILVPGFLLKIDWATPWDLVSYLPIRKWEGNFSVGYEY